MRSRVSAIALAVAAALPSLASAVDFSYSGFSTAGYAQTDTDLAQVGFSGQPEGVDEDGSWEFDSKLGLQVTAKFNDMFSATVQGVAYEDLTSKWEPHLDWAYLRFQPLSSLSLRAGDMRAPTFMYSDSVFIGYANSWIRTPLEVYRLTPVYQLRGVDVLWRQTFGKATVSLQPYYGESEIKAGEDAATIEVPEWYGLVASVEVGSLSLRAGYSTLSLNEDQTDERLEPAIQALRGMAAMGCAPCAIDADALTIGGMEMDLLSVGAQYDNGSSVVIAEYAKRETGTLVTNDMSSAYFTVGHRFGGLMPYATYAIARRDGDQESAIPANSPFAALRSIADGVTAATANDQDTYSLGLRYDVPGFSVLKGAIVKLQYDHIKAKEGNGLFINVQPGFEGKADMISATFDFIF
jgi:hypothetical protein